MQPVYGSRGPPQPLQTLAVLAGSMHLSWVEQQHRVQTTLPDCMHPDGESRGPRQKSQVPAVHQRS